MNAIREFRGDHAFLSNFAFVDVVVDGVIFQSVEHGFQASKTFDKEWRLCIMLCETPRAAKVTGKRVPLRPDWEAVKVGIMRDLLRQKFSNEYYKKLLLETGDAYLEEGNEWGDRFWGVSPVGSGNGQNILGQLIMEVRDELNGITDRF